MGAEKLSSRAIIGTFYQQLAMDPGAGWLDKISMLFNSDQASEEYAWLGQSPAMREWIGGRHAKGFRENGLTIKNKHFEASIEVLVSELRRDKTGQVLARIRDLAARTNSHWASLLTSLIINGATTVCYDGQYFFDTDHSEGDSGTQSNKINADISALPAIVHGSAVTAPSVEEMQQSIILGIAQILSFKDDQGEPLNETASQFLVMAPMSLYAVANNALAMPRGTNVSEQKIPATFSVDLVVNARLSAWTDKFVVFRADGNVKPFIRQEEVGVALKAIAEGSELEFKEDKHQYGVDTWRNVGYGYWQQACQVTLI